MEETRTKVDDKHIGVARLYTLSLLGLAEKAGQADDVRDELREIAGLLERDAPFADFVTSPLINPEARASSLDKLFRGRLSDVLLDTLQVMNEKGRLAVLPTMAELYRLEHQSLRGRVDVHVKTPVPLKIKLREKLKRALAELLGKEADLTVEVDDGLIGGMILKVGDLKIDASARSRIEGLRHALHDRVRRELDLSRKAIEV